MRVSGRLAWMLLLLLVVVLEVSHRAVGMKPEGTTALRGPAQPKAGDSATQQTYSTDGAAVKSSSSDETGSRASSPQTWSSAIPEQTSKGGEGTPALGPAKATGGEGEETAHSASIRKQLIRLTKIWRKITADRSLNGIALAAHTGVPWTHETIFEEVFPLTNGPTEVDEPTLEPKYATEEEGKEEDYPGEFPPVYDSMDYLKKVYKRYAKNASDEVWVKFSQSPGWVVELKKINGKVTFAPMKRKIMYNLPFDVFSGHENGQSNMLDSEGSVQDVQTVINNGSQTVVPKNGLSKTLWNDLSKMFDSKRSGTDTQNLTMVQKKEPMGSQYPVGSPPSKVGEGTPALGPAEATGGEGKETAHSATSGTEGTTPTVLDEVKPNLLSCTPEILDLCEADEGKASSDGDNSDD
eukprot:GHVS01078527.1.p1 GENE.GHVS01078527.1~~GHVS01078527.1.p1  ORF type:complete len:409 (-),score=58.76 GHVS01078527.1:380-1606(-)